MDTNSGMLDALYGDLRFDLRTKRAMYDKVIDALSEIYTPAQINEFMSAPQKLLNYAVPMKLIVRGRGDEVYDVVQRLLVGAYI